MSDGVLPAIVIFWAVAVGFVSLQQRGNKTELLTDEQEEDVCSESRLVDQLASTKQKWQYDVEMEPYLRQLPKVGPCTILILPYSSTICGARILI